MPPPKSIEAYNDCEAYFARALSSQKGIAITLLDPGAVTQLAQKMNHYRERLRKDSKRVYVDPNDPRHGSSIYDKLQVGADKENPNRLLIRPYEIKALKVEDL